MRFVTLLRLIGKVDGALESRERDNQWLVYVNISTLQCARACAIDKHIYLLLLAKIDLLN